MKNFIRVATFSLFLFISQLAQSQNNMRVGFLGGAGMSKVSFTDSASNSGGDAAFAFAGGGTFECMFGLVAVNSGIIFEGRQSEYHSSTSFFGFSATVDSKSKYSFLTVPLTGGLNLAVGGRFKFGIGAGAYVSFLLSTNTRTETRTSGFSFPGFPTIPPTTTITNTDNKDYYKPIDMGLCFYTGFGITLTEKIDFVFRVQDHLGLINTVSDPKGNESAKFHSFYGLVGMSFSL